MTQATCPGAGPADNVTQTTLPVGQLQASKERLSVGAPAGVYWYRSRSYAGSKIVSTLKAATGQDSGNRRVGDLDQDGERDL